MVKRTITITTILLILAMVVSLIIVLNKSSFAADDDIASGTDGTCSWIINANGVLIISPSNGTSGTLARHSIISQPNPPWYNKRESITKIIVNPGVKAHNESYQLFAYLENVTEVDLSGLDTSDVTDMSAMFWGCSSLLHLNLSTFNSSNVETIENMFRNCSSLLDVNLSSFDTSKVTIMHNMFYECRALQCLDLSNFDTSNVTSMGYMFGYCTALKEVKLGSNFSFLGNGITIVDRMAKLPTPSNTPIYSGNWIRNDYAYGPYSPDELKDEYNGQTMAGTWVLDLRPCAVFCEDGTLNFIRPTTTSIYTPGSIDTVHSISGEEYTGTIFTVNETNTSWSSGYGPFNDVESQVTKVVFIDEIKPKCLDLWFDDFSKCTEMDIEKLNTSDCVTMKNLFQGCIKLTAIDVTGFDTSNVSNMAGMFMDCHKLTNVDISGFNTSQVTTMSQMFDNCYVIQDIDLSNFDTSKVTSMYYMFGSCHALKSINVSNFDTSQVKSFEGMFMYCTSITSLDLSNWNTAKATNMFNTFFATTSLSSVILGENFKFNGNSITRWIAYLMDPPSTMPYTGKWIREDTSFGPYTATELTNNYTPEMAGTWVWEKNIYKFNVTYSYSNPVPEGASNLPTNEEYEYSSQVTVAENATAPGYTFSGWSRTGTFEMPAEDVLITGSFIANTNTPYKVEHYLEDLNSDTYTLAKTDNLTGTTDTEVNAEARTYEGFTFDDSVDGTKLSGNIAGDESLVLKLYYRRNSYNVSYSYTGDIPNDASTIPSDESYKYGAEITVPENATAEGYTFSGWIKDYITMPAQDIEITGYFIEIPKSYSYKVEYFFDGELDDSLDEILNAELDSEISIVPQTPLKHGDKNYTLVSNNHSITVSINEEDNIIEVYYESDVLDYEFETPEGDGIPDRYQIKVIYKVENGKWDDGTIETKIEIVTLKDKNGNLSEEGTGTINVPQVGSKPAEGYIKGLWNREIPSEVFSKDDRKEFIYSYEKVMEADIAELEGKASNPKTDDIMNRYLLSGVGGILVLMLVSRIRRRYSRKAKKIQF